MRDQVFETFEINLRGMYDIEKIVHFVEYEKASIINFR